jgi:AraC-like DNA-binding protein
MITRFDNFDLHFNLGYYEFHISNIVQEQFERSIPLHSHSKNSYEIHYIPYGLGTATINGKLYEVTPNTLYITGPYVEHSQIPNQESPMCEYCIYLKVKKITLNICPSSESSLTERFLNTTFWFGQDSQDIHLLMKQLFFELQHRNTGYEIQAELLLKQLIVKLVRNYEIKSEKGIESYSINLVDNKYLIIEECFLYEYKTLTLEILSQRLGLGIRQTERLLKTHYGKSFLQKRTQARMSAACIMLHNQDLSITKIAEETGYSCLEHFSSAFNNFYGISASTYRKQILSH